jgi:hypothetical protein
MQIFNDSNSFSTYIEGMVREHKGLTHMEAVIKYCSDNFIEPSDVKKLINKSLKQKIQVDFENDGYLPKSATLDI